MSPASTPNVHQVKLIDRHLVAEGTMRFRFERPPGFRFVPGQFMDVTLLHPSETDAEGDTRAFSLAGAPHEDHLMVATRLRDTAFKRVLRNLPLGTTVQIEGPAGDLVLPDDSSRPVALLAGGIGITPFRSMVVHAAWTKSPQRIVLFFSNHRAEDAPFLDELLALERENPRYTCIATMTGQDTSSRPWKGETGFITAELLSRHLEQTGAPIYYVAGPPGLVKGVCAMLAQAGVNDRDIRSEEFGGY